MVRKLFALYGKWVNTKHLRYTIYIIHCHIRFPFEIKGCKNAQWNFDKELRREFIKNQNFSIKFYFENDEKCLTSNLLRNIGTYRNISICHAKIDNFVFVVIWIKFIESFFCSLWHICWQVIDHISHTIAIMQKKIS